MKNKKVFSPLFTSLLFASVALAQSADPALPDAPQPQDSTSSQIESTTVANTEAADDGKLITQARPYPRFPRRPMGPSYGHAYRSGPMPGLSPVGALIGFGFGAVLGATRSQDTSTNARVASGLLVGALCALIGGAIGDAAHNLEHARRNSPPPGPNDDADSDLRAAAKVHAKRSVAASPATVSESARAEDMAPPSQEMLAVP